MFFTERLTHCMQQFLYAHSFYKQFVHYMRQFANNLYIFVLFDFPEEALCYLIFQLACYS